MTATKKLIDDFDKGHTGIFGITESGKTYGAKKSLERVQHAVLFLNTQHVEMPKSFLKAEPSAVTWGQIEKKLKSNGKINLLAPRNKEERSRIVDLFVKKLFEMGGDKSKRIIFVVDEVHLLDKQATESLIEYTTTGLRWGLHLAYISQRPANVDKTLFTQSTKIVLFKTSFEGEYLKNKGIPAQRAEEMLSDGGEYAYCEFVGTDLKGAFKV